MRLFKIRKYNFHEGFLEEGNIPFYYRTFENSIKGNTIKNVSLEKKSTNNGIGVVNCVPPYFQFHKNDIDETYDFHEIKTYKGFMANLSNYEGIDHYIRSHLSKQKIKVLRKRTRNLENSFNIEYKIITGKIGDKEYETLFNELLLMIEKRFSQKSKIHSAIIKWDRYKEKAISLIRNKQACFTVIYANEVPIAISLGYLRENIFFSAITSYNIDYAKFGLGNIMIYKKLEWCFDNGYAVYDMAWGDLCYKRDWCDTIYNFSTHVLFKRKLAIHRFTAYSLKLLILAKVNLREKGVLSKI